MSTGISTTKVWTPQCTLAYYKSTFYILVYNVILTTCHTIEKELKADDNILRLSATFQDDNRVYSNFTVIHGSEILDYVFLLINDNDNDNNMVCK